MQTLGLIGGTSWVSTVDYYKLINQGINEQLGGLNFSQCIIYSFNYADIKKNNDANDWDSTFKMVSKACHHLKESGAAAIVLCANTLHVIANRLQQEVGLPIIHIADATVREITTSGIKKVALLGTKFTMELPFFTSKLQEAGIAVVIPEPEDRDFIHATIADELGKGIFKDETKKRYLDIIGKLAAAGAEGVILGCTEIPLLLRPEEVPIPVFDTMLLHARAAVAFSLRQ